MSARALVNVPASARRGEVITIKTLIAHPMETGFRPGPNGTVIARDIIGSFTCTYDGEVVFSADFSPAIAANPYLTFTTVATQTGTLLFTWAGDGGFAAVATAPITVS